MPQRNWLITQFINNTLRQQDIYIRVKYSINSECTGSCLTALDVYVLQTNEVNQGFVRNVSVFNQLTIAAVLTDNIRDGSTLTTHIVKISADLSTSGLYVAFKDYGTCIGLSEITVYYPICDVVSFDFGANFSMDQLPGGTSVGSCFANMAVDINTSSGPFNATCTVSMPSWNELLTNWTINGDSSGCMCLPGYQFTSRTTTNQCEGKVAIFSII